MPDSIGFDITNHGNGIKKISKSLNSSFAQKFKSFKNDNSEMNAED